MKIHQPARAIGTIDRTEYLVELEGVRFPQPLLIEGGAHPRRDGDYGEHPGMWVEITVWMGANMVALTLAGDLPVVTTTEVPAPTCSAVRICQRPAGHQDEHVALPGWTRCEGDAIAIPTAQHAHPEA